MKLRYFWIIRNNSQKLKNPEKSGFSIINKIVSDKN